MKFLFPEAKYIAEGHNAVLGELVCYSCGEHSVSAYDKILWADSTHLVYVSREGNFIFGCSCCNQALLNSLASELEAVSVKDLEPFGAGVSFQFYGKRIECSQCGSEEFYKPKS